MTASQLFRFFVAVLVSLANASAAAQFLLPGSNAGQIGGTGSRTAGPSAGTATPPGAGYASPMMGPVLPTVPSAPGQGAIPGTTATQAGRNAGGLPGPYRMRGQMALPDPSGTNGRSTPGLSSTSRNLCFFRPGNPLASDPGSAEGRWECYDQPFGDAEGQGASGPDRRSAIRSGDPTQPPSDFQVYVEQATGQLLPVFGMASFANQRFAAIQTNRAPDTYVIGPGDELIVQVYGAIEFQEPLIVDREGRISVPKLGPIRVAGLRLGEVEAQLFRSIGQVYRNFRVSVSMGRLRAIEIYLVGQAQFPGRKVVSSLSTAINTLFETGGPSTRGSMRAIELRRGGRLVTRIDLYDFIARGDSSADRLLESGDTLFIPPVGPQVAISGSVNEPAIYELKEAERKIRGLLELSGGLPVLASPRKARIERVAPEQDPARFVQDLTLDANGLETALRAGDIVHVVPISLQFANSVSLVGSVASPTRYAFRRGMRISDLVASNNFLVPVSYWLRLNSGAAMPGLNQPEINLDYATLQRFDQVQMTTTTVAFNLAKALQGNSAENLLLEPGDVVRTYLASEPAPAALNSVELNAVFLSGPRRFSWKEGYRIRDVIPDPAWLNERITRWLRAPEPETDQDPPNDPSLGPTARRVDTGRSASQDPLRSNADFQLMPQRRTGRDSFASASGPARAGQGTAQPAGAPRSLDPVRSGQDGAYTFSAQELNLEFASIERLNPTTLQWSLIHFNLRRALAGEELHNVALQTGDRINLYTKKEIEVPNAQRTRLVKISGEVQVPGTYQANLGETLEQLISRAGGLTGDAYLPGTSLLRESVRSEQQRNLEQLLRLLESDLAAQTAFIAQNLSQSDSATAQALIASQRQTLDRFRTLRASGRIALDLDPSTLRPALPRIELEDGDQIQVPRISDFVGVFGAVDISSSLVFRQGQRVRDYLDRAGLKPAADLENIVILRADGSARTPRTVTQRRALLAWRGEDLLEQQIYPGESILVPEQIDRRSPYVRFITGAKDWTQLIYQFGLGAAAFKVLRQ